jgi:hypothetical protein
MRDSAVLRYSGIEIYIGMRDSAVLRYSGIEIYRYEG